MTRRRAVVGGLGAIAIAVIVWIVHGRASTPAPADAAIVAPITPRARIKALLHPDGGAIAGRVTTAGQPLAGATVCARDQRVACATSDASGAYELADLAPGSYVVWASAPGFLAHGPKSPVKLASRARVPLDLVLADAGVVVTGTVSDVRGKPIAGATVRVGTTRDAPRYTATSATDGTFRAWAPAGDVFVAATADGFIDAETDAIAPSDGVAIAMTPESVLAGTVVRTGTREPVADAEVSADGETARSDAAGHFAIVKVRPGRYKPSATAIGGYGEVAESVRVALGQRIDGLVIELHPVAAVIGAIVVDDGTPCPPDAGSVWLSRYGSAASYTAKTIADGTIVLEGVVPGTYEVSATCRGFLPRQPYPDLVVGDSDVDSTIWKVSPGARITGRIVDQASAPIADATVSHMEAGGTFGGSVAAAADGTFALTGVLPGVAEVSGYAAGFLRSPTPVRVIAAIGADATATIVMARGGGLAGTVRDGAGKPVANVRVSARGPDDSGNTRSDRAGAFEMSALAPGAYDVSIDLDWGRLHESPPVKATVATGQVSHVALVVEATSGAISGTVVDAAGAAVSDAYVEIALVDDDGKPGLRHGDPVLTDLAGGFTFTELVGGKFNLRARRRGGAEVVASPVALGAHPRLVMPATGVLAGIVVGDVEDVTIAAEDRTRDLVREERLFHTGGRFALRELPAGRYKVTVDGDPRSSITIVLADGERREDLRLVVQPRFTVRGRLVGASGRPLIGWRIEAPRLQLEDGREDGRQITVFTVEQALTDADGRFLVRDMPAGPLEISAGDVAHDPDAGVKLIATPVLGGATLVIEVGDLRYEGR